MKNKKILPILSAVFVITSCISKNQSEGASLHFEGSNKTLSLKKTSVIKDDSDFEYEFDKDGNYKTSHKDEFETEDALDGIHSASGIVNAQGKVTETKTAGETIEGAPAVQSFNDTKENNDDFRSATNMYSVGTDEAGVYKHWVWCQATISQKKEGFWLWEKTYIDKDFYSFDMVSTGTLTVTLENIPTNCDYDLRLYRLEDSPIANVTTMNFEEYIAKSSLGSNLNEKIEVSAKPGTYYACVYSYLDKTYDNDNPYKITFEEAVDTTRAGSNYSISEGRSNGDLGAIWISDYAPLGITPSTIYRDHNNKTCRQTYSNYDDYPYIRHLADKYSDWKDMTYAILYVWDVETRAAIYGILKTVLKTIDNYGDWSDSQEKEVSILYNETSLYITIAGLALATLSLANIGGQLVAALGFLSAELSTVMGIGALASCYVTSNPFVTTKERFRDYLISMISAFEVGTGSNDKEVVMMRFKYHFGRSNMRYVEWLPMYDVDEGTRYNSDAISFQTKGSGIDGRVFGFKNEADVNFWLGL